MTDNPWQDVAPLTRGRRKSVRNSLLTKIVPGVVVAVFAGIVALAAYSLLDDSQPTERRVVQISVLVPPPLPPSPPPEVKTPKPADKPPELVVRDHQKPPEPERQQQAEQAPVSRESPGPDLKGIGSGESIDLAGNKGGESGPTIGGGGGDRARFGWFASAIENQLKDHLQKNETLRRSGYQITIRLWIRNDGWIERYELVDSVGNPELDRGLRTALEGMPRLERRPPAEMPQPVTLRITARAVDG
jgi:outer membrane biosynthesis protein TonB